MENNLNVTIFNPTDKLNERHIDKPKIYLGCVPSNKRNIFKKNGCIYNTSNYQWCTTNKNNKMIRDFSRRNIDFWQYMDEVVGIKYDKETKKWYTYNSNGIFSILKTFKNL